ncbi:radical SAM protein [Anoxybacterium hadale]|uniref:Radical SAM protein n=1 Tax=Anoxybacterium hadale TaxID=3408580 RepID=A0ACD1A784_9FIRM|nr:radical SAM protein [Clostridiales bacterium]
MKSHAIIPIFIPHLGCPNDCIFCNQKKITAQTSPVTLEDMKATAERYLSTLSSSEVETIEMAFYGGSFTGIPMELQQEYLAVAKDYKDRGLIQKIHLSTRPDYINEEILENLKKYDVDIIELGVQSLDEEVLRLSNRGHDRECVFKASELIQSYGFTLGLQLMIGLPGDTHEKSVKSAREVVEIGPSIARLYPTVIIRDTDLYELYQTGKYQPLTIEAAVYTTKEMYLILTKAGINVIRIGLKSTDLISENGAVIGGYHPAFRQLVESEIAKDQMEAQLTACLSSYQCNEQGSTQDSLQGSYRFYSSGPSFSNMVGNGKSNRLYFEKKYPHVRISFHVDHSLPDGVFVLEKR